MTACANPPPTSAVVSPVEPGEVGKLMQWIVEACAAARIPEKTSFAVQLCLDEAVANIMEHGARGAAATSAIWVSLERGEVDVVLNIEDDGQAFDPTTVAPPAPAQSLDELTVGGLGVHFIRQYSTRLEYSRSAGRNRLRLTFATQ